MANQQANVELYQKMICDMVQDIRDGRFLKQVYSYIYREQRRSGRLQRELHTMIENMSTEDLRLLYIAAQELRKQ